MGSIYTWSVLCIFTNRLRFSWESVLPESGRSVYELRIGFVRADETRGFAVILEAVIHFETGNLYINFCASIHFMTYSNIILRVCWLMGIIFCRNIKNGGRGSGFSVLDRVPSHGLWIIFGGCRYVAVWLLCNIFMEFYSEATGCSAAEAPGKQ